MAAGFVNSNIMKSITSNVDRRAELLQVQLHVPLRSDFQIFSDRFGQDFIVGGMVFRLLIRVAETLCR